MRDFQLRISVLFAALVACGDSGGATAASDSSSTSTASTTASTADPSTGTTATTDEATDGSATSDATSTTTTGTTGAPSTTTADPSTTTDDTTTTTGDTTTTDTTDTTDTTTRGDTTGDGTSPLVIAIVDAELWADCMPVVDPDPVQGSWYVEFDNTNNPADTEAVVTGAWLSLAGGDPKVEPIAVDPVASGPIKAGDYVSLKLEKLKGQSHGACGHCDEFYDLVLEYDEGGIAHHVEEAVTISCIF